MAVKNYYTYSLSNSKKELEPTQFYLSSFVSIHFGNEKNGFRLVDTMPYPSKTKYAKDKRSYVEKQIKAYEKKRRQLNLLKKKQRERRKKEKEELKKFKKDEKKSVQKFFTERYFSYSLANKDRELAATSWKASEQFTIHFGNSKLGFDELVTKKIPARFKTASQKKKYVLTALDKLQKEREESLRQYTEKYFSHNDRTKVVDYKIMGDKIILSTIKVLEGLGRDNVLKVRQEYLFYNRPQSFTPTNKTLFLEQQKKIKQDSSPLSDELFKIKKGEPKFIYKFLVSMKNADNESISQGFSTPRAMLDNKDELNILIDRTSKYFETKQGGKYLSFFQEFQLDGMMLERTLESV